MYRFYIHQRSASIYTPLGQRPRRMLALALWHADFGVSDDVGRLHLLDADCAPHQLAPLRAACLGARNAKLARHEAWLLDPLRR